MYPGRLSTLSKKKKRAERHENLHRIARFTIRLQKVVQKCNRRRLDSMLRVFFINENELTRKQSMGVLFITLCCKYKRIWPYRYSSTRVPTSTVHCVLVYTHVLSTHVFSRYMYVYTRVAC